MAPLELVATGSSPSSSASTAVSTPLDFNASINWSTQSLCALTSQLCQLADANTEDNISLDQAEVVPCWADHPGAATQPSSSVLNWGKITLHDLFDVNNCYWKGPGQDSKQEHGNIPGHKHRSAITSLNEEMELYELMDLDAIAEPGDYDPDIDNTITSLFNI